MGLEYGFCRVSMIFSCPFPGPLHTGHFFLFIVKVGSLYACELGSVYSIEESDSELVFAVCDVAVLPHILLVITYRWMDWVFPLYFLLLAAWSSGSAVVFC